MLTNSKSNVYKSLDLFSGCGGLSSGLSWSRGEYGSRIEVAAAIDNWAAACNTYARNVGVQPIVTGVTNDSIKSALSQTGNVDLIVGGPPCQGFSTVGKRALDDPRNELVKTFFTAIELARPRAFLMENVTGFTSFQSGALMREVMNRASELGYNIAARIVLASLHGVPQRRRRFILVGVKGEQYHFPQGSQFMPVNGMNETLFGNSFEVPEEKSSDGLERWSFDDATSDLPPLKAGEAAHQYLTLPQNDLQEWYRTGSTELTLHTAASHSETFVKMMSYIPVGKSALHRDVLPLIPIEFRPTSGFANSYARIDGQIPAPTITRNFTTPSSANCIHPHQDRALTLREGARCQTFPDRFEFLGNNEDRRLQIGNAVPPLLARELGLELLRAMDNSS